MKKYLLAVLLVCVMVSVVFAAPTKVAFVYVGPVGDAGWTYAHNEGRLYLEQMYGKDIETAFIESVPEGSEAEAIIRGYAQRGYDLVFTTSFGYMDPTIKIAEMFPKTTFMHCSGYKTAENVGTYFGRMYEPRFLSGLIAGAMTKSDIIGYVAAFPIPEVVRGINAFALGVKYVNPNAKVQVVWSNTWFDMGIEKEAAISLLDVGADVITQHQDSPAPQQAAEERGAYSIAYNSDMRAFAPKAFLAAPVWNWGPYYSKVVKAVKNGDWKSDQYWGGMADEVVGIVMSDLVPASTQNLVRAVKDAIVKDGFHPFAGPIYNQKGELMIKEGEVASDGMLLGMDWFVDNVVGKISE